MWVILLLLATTAAAQSPDYAPGPQPGVEAGSPYSFSSPPAPSLGIASPPSSLTPGFAPVPAPLSAPFPAPFSAPLSAPFSAPLSAPFSAPLSAPVPAPNGLSPDEGPSPALESPGPAAADLAADVRWCAVRNDEYEDCLALTSQFDSSHLSWTCVLRENKGQCMEAIQKGQADLMSLEAGLAYIAFLNYSMKAILAEEYSFHAQSYGAVAVVNKQMCDDNPNLKLGDYKNLKSCHSQYLSAAGWNYPVQNLLNSVAVDTQILNDASIPNDAKVLSSFFSKSCAPSELAEGGICTGCGNGDNSSFCSSINNKYTGEDGAFRCLMDGSGDIAFLRAETPILYSSDGLNSLPWATKSLDEFMYLCPSGGCKAINANHAECQFAVIPANVIMTQNSLPEPVKQAAITTLLHANWTQTLYTGRNWRNSLLSVSTQGLAQVTQLTRQYLNTSAQVSQTIMDLDANRINVTAITSSAVKSGVSAYALKVALSAFAVLAFGTFFDL
ncbi:unnamed protein product [Calypogeia fissa]